MNTCTCGEASKPTHGETAAALIQLETVKPQAVGGDVFTVIQSRAETITVVLEGILHSPPPPHFDGNE